MIAIRGDLASLDAGARRLLLDRAGAADPAIADETRRIIAAVRADGDAALRRMARDYDRVELDALEVPRGRLDDSLGALPANLRAALERAAANIRAVHEAFRPRAVVVTTPDGVRIGRRPDPLRRAGVYAPGGSAAYASSVLMGVVPAKVAGVDEVILCSPPAANGLPAPIVLAAAAIAGADRVFAIGGAGAIAAMAYGTATIPRVDRVTGPGNAWVAEAKTQVAGIVGVDAPAGPSEVLIIADDTANPSLIARELLAQAEHDPRAGVVLVALDPKLPAAVEGALTAQLARAPRAAIARQALARQGALLTAGNAAEAVAFAEQYAPEHLLLVCRDAADLAKPIRGAGTIFVGAASSVVFGDYLTGANHVLPTGAAARSWSGLSTADFCRWTTWQDVPDAVARVLADDTVLLAEAEGLPAHAAAAAAWSAR